MESPALPCGCPPAAARQPRGRAERHAGSRCRNSC